MSAQGAALDLVAEIVLRAIHREPPDNERSRPQPGTASSGIDATNVTEDLTSSVGHER